MRTRPNRWMLTGLTGAFAALVALPALAGHKEKHCSAAAEVCVRMMADNLAKKGWIGIEMHEKDAKGRPVVTRVVPDSPAVQAGFQVGDTLTAINGVSDADGEEAAYAEWKRSMVPANQVVVTVERAGKMVDLEVTLGTIPDAVIAQWIGHHMLEQHIAEAPAPEAESDTESPR